MKQLFLMGWLGLGLASSVQAGTTPIYENYITLTTAPQIDATAFINAGVMDLYTPLPFDTQNTLYFTNYGSGTLSGSVGFRFDHVTDTGRGWSDTFVNLGNIQATEYGYSYVIGGSMLSMYGLLSGSYLLVSATNIYNSGMLTSGNNGIIRLEGGYVNLTRGGLRTGPPLDLTGMGTTNINYGGLGYETLTNYSNPSGVTDLYWGVGVNDGLGEDGQPLSLTFNSLKLPNPRSPMHAVVENYSALIGGGGIGGGGLYLYTNLVTVPQYYYGSLGGYTAVAITNRYSPTNQLVQVIFVPTNNVGTNFTITPRFSGGGAGYTALIEFSLTDVDVTTRQVIQNLVYLMDRTASMNPTNFVLLTNRVDGTLRRPAALQVTRSTPYQWAMAVEGNTPFSPSLLYNPNYALTVVSNLYAAYSADINSATGGTIDRGGSGYSGTVASDPTNSVGRIEINADTLDLNQARIRAEGLVSIKTRNLVGNEGLALDAPVLNFDLSTTNGSLVIDNLIPSDIRRLSGQISAWSGLWTNQLLTVVTSIDTNGVDTTVTNSIDVKTHVLIVDPYFQTSVSPSISEFAGHGTNVWIKDQLVISKDFRIDAQNLRITGAIDYTGLGETNLPGLMNLTNAGSIIVINETKFGSDRPAPYSNWVNSGSVSASSVSVRALQLRNSGSVHATGGPLFLQAEQAWLDGSPSGQFAARSNIRLAATDAQIRKTIFRAGSIETNYFSEGSVTYPGALILLVTNRLTDGGADANNDWQCLDGIQLLRKPARGDLLGTRVTSKSTVFGSVVHVWAAEDRGPSATGYSNNAALGRLILDGAEESVFVFRGTGTNNALYVDYLEFRNTATNFQTSVIIEPGFNLYFANANLAPEKINGSLQGRLRWVSGYAGPASSTNWISPTTGRVYPVNLVLRASENIDSDGDGLFNQEDPMPFYFAESVQLMAGVSGVPVLTWNTLANATNYVEFKTNLTDSGWTAWTNLVRPTSGSMTLTLPVAEAPQRFYRVRVQTLDP